MVSLKDIAGEVGVSTAAVSKALNDLPGVSDATRLRIKRAAERMGYEKYLRTRMVNAYQRRMKFIVVLYGRIGGHLIENIQAGVDETIRRKGYIELRYLIDTTKDMLDEQRKEFFLKSLLHEKGVAGVLACYVSLSDALISRLYENQMPVVLLEHPTDFGRCVTIDHTRAAYKATARLIERGRKQIGCIMPHEDIARVWRDRLEGYKRAHKDKHRPYDPSLIEHESMVGVREAAEATRLLLTRKPGVDGILYGSDRQAYGGLKTIREAGRRIPEDVAVIGFDDIDYNDAVDPPLTSIRQPIRKMAETGISLLFDSIDKQDFSHRAIVMDTELILRASCP